MSETGSDNSPSRRPELDLLDVLVGRWETLGEITATPSTPPTRFTAEDTYEWLPGKHFLLHRWDARMPDGRSQGLEIIGYDSSSSTYPIHVFDDRGQIVIYEGRRAEDVWTIRGPTERFTGRISPDGRVVSGVWERSAPEGWTRWMTVTLTKVQQDPG